MAHALPTPPIIPDPDTEAAFQQHVAFILMTVRNKGRLPEGREVRNRWHERLELPKKVRFHGLRGPRKRPRKEREWYKVLLNLLGVGFDHNKQQARTARMGLDAKLQPYRVQRVHTLGWGGHGIACLFRDMPVGGAAPEFFVAKCNMTQTPAARALLREEKSKQRVYRGALHVVQTKETPPPPPPPNPANPNPALPLLDDILFLEYHARGDLHKVFGTVAARAANPPPGPQPPPIPNRVLWLMFQCLVQAVIALEHPPARDWDWSIQGLIHPNGLFNGQHPFSERIPPAPPAGPQVPPGVPYNPWSGEGPTIRGTGFVHFDIDPQNILFGNRNHGPQSDHHTHFPVLKVGDFGSGTNVTNTVLGNRRTMWNFRRISKTDYCTPEQFSHEWDWVAPTNPFFMDPPLDTAGKFSWKTNLYQFALVMFSAITLCFPDAPQFPEEISIPDPNGGGGKIDVWSYGVHLLDKKFNHIDRKLRELVAQCLCDKPAHRPDLADLKNTIDNHLQAQNWAGHDSDAALTQWITANIDSPPPVPGAPQRPYWVDQ